MWIRIESHFRRLWFRVRSLLHRRRLEQDLADEIGHHLELRGAALADEEAARRRFGNRTLIMEACREMHQFVALESLLRDVRISLRGLARNPAFSLTVVLLLALGVGANSAVYSTINGLLFRPLPGVADPEQVVGIGRAMNGDGFDTISFPNFADLARRATLLESVAGYRTRDAVLDTGQASERIAVQAASTTLFDVLRAKPARGRTFTATEDSVTGKAPVAVVSQQLANRLYGTADQALGKSLTLNRRAFTVVGVMPAEFRGPAMDDLPQVWVPLHTYAWLIPGEADEGGLFRLREANWMFAVARMKPGVTLQQASAEIDSIAAQLRGEYPGPNEDVGYRLSPAGIDPFRRSDFERISVFLVSITSLVLLVACFNVGNLLIARGAARGREIAIRLSLGGGRAQLLRQLLIECGLLGLAGALTGVWAAYAAGPIMRALVPGFSTAVFDLSPDWRVLVVSLALGLGSAVVFGVAPAVRALQCDIGPVLKDGPSQGGTSRGSLRRWMAVVQLATCCLLLVAGGLLTRTLRNALNTELGFDPRGVLTASYDLAAAAYSNSAARVFHDRLLGEVRAMPGVSAVALAMHAPLGGSASDMPVVLEGEQEPRPARFNAVSARYFETMAMRVRQGRGIVAADLEQSPKIAVINETLARRYFGNQNPVGRKLRMVLEKEPREIVGVVQDSKYSQPLEQVRPALFLPLTQFHSDRVAIHVRTPDPGRIALVLQERMHKLDSALPLFRVASVEELFDAALWQQRLASALTAGLSLLALILASAGIYGLLAYSVQQRGREIGVRMALGAKPGVVLREIIGQGMRLALWGMLFGVPLSLAAAGLLRSQLFGVSPYDPWTYAGVAALLLGATAIACMVPAWRASRTDPLRVLRAE